MSATRAPSAGGRVSGVGLPALGVIVAIAAWWVSTDVFNVRPIFVPSPPAVVEAFGRQSGYLARESWATLYKMLVGFAIATAGGLVTALLLSSSRAVERAVFPLFLALNAIPKVAIAPLLLVWMGFGAAPNIVMVVLICFLPVMVSTMAGLGATPADLGELARSLSASWWQTYLKVRVPWALPHVFVGLKLAISLAVIGAIVAEIANPNSGLGSIIVLAGASADTALAFAAIAVLAVLGVLLFYAVVGIERLVLPWARAISG
jgi:NitT/TauT family transport system permease protein